MISVKKLITVGAAAGLMLGTAVPAMAYGFGGQMNFAHIWNSVSASSNTGANSVGGELEDHSSTTTGNAATGVDVSNFANKNVKVGWGGSSQLNSARVGNSISASSNTGSNSVGGEVEDSSSTKTGNAATGVVVTNVVNKNVSVGFSGFGI